MNRHENNPFSAAWLVYPIEQREEYVRFCQTENSAHSDEAPFPRRADMWFASLALHSAQRPAASGLEVPPNR